MLEWAPSALLPLVTRGPGRPPIEDTPEAALQSERRREILSLVEKYPGLPASELQSLSGMGAGAFYAQLHKLRDSGLIETRDTVTNTRIYPAGKAPPEEESILLSATTRWVASSVLKRPGQSSAEISEDVGFGQRVIQKHLKRLVEEGFIEARRNGLRRTYAPTARLRRSLSRKKSH